MMANVLNAGWQSNTCAERRTPPLHHSRRQFVDDERNEDTDLAAWKQWEST